MDLARERVPPPTRTDKRMHEATGVAAVRCKVKLPDASGVQEPSSSVAWLSKLRASGALQPVITRRCTHRWRPRLRLPQSSWRTKRCIPLCVRRTRHSRSPWSQS